MLAKRTFNSAALIVSVLALWLVLLAAAGRATEAAGYGPDYNLPLWVASRLSRVWLNPLAVRVGGGYHPASEAQLLQFLSGSSAVAAAERDLAYAQASGADRGAAAQRLHNRVASLDPLAWPVEQRLAGELTEVIREQGLDSTLPGLRRVRFVWPPVAFGYELPPYLLIRSPRDRIELTGTTLLRSDLTTEEAAALVAKAQARGDSALVVRIGGLAAYPSIVEEDDNYADALDLLAHEWTHQYLFFQPLGIRYFQSRNLTTINETVANIVGRELSANMRARFPLAGVPVSVRSSAPPADPTVNFDRTLHQLRLDVDALLAQGRIDEAERRMNETQRFLVEHGYYVSRINQAYFAFYGTYADTAASTSVLGPRLAQLRARYPTLGAFVHAVQNVRSAADFNSLVEASPR